MSTPLGKRGEPGERRRKQTLQKSSAGPVEQKRLAKFARRFGLPATSSERAHPSGLRQFAHQGGDSQNVAHAPEMMGEHRQGHLATHPAQAPNQEASLTEDALLQISAGVFDDGPVPFHHLRMGQAACLRGQLEHAGVV